MSPENWGAAEVNCSTSFPHFTTWNPKTAMKRRIGHCHSSPEMWIKGLWKSSSSQNLPVLDIKTKYSQYGPSARFLDFGLRVPRCSHSWVDVITLTHPVRWTDELTEERHVQPVKVSKVQLSGVHWATAAATAKSIKKQHWNSNWGKFGLESGKEQSLKTAKRHCCDIRVDPFSDKYQAWTRASQQNLFFPAVKNWIQALAFC